MRLPAAAGELFSETELRFLGGKSESGFLNPKEEFAFFFYKNSKNGSCIR